MSALGFRKNRVTALAHLLSAAPTASRVRRYGADIALAFLVSTVVVMLTMSAELLANAGYHYFTPGGFPWEKIHPATILATCALAARIFGAERPGEAASRIIGQDRMVLLYLLAIVIAAGHAALVSKTPVTTLIDTFVLPILLFWLLRGLDPRIRRTLALLTCILMGLNATIGLVEYMSGGWRLVPVPGIDASGLDLNHLDPTLDTNLRAALSDWRATALLGHPLENALVTGVLILCLSAPGARWLPPILRFPLLGLSALAMVAFGGRTSLVLSLGGLVLFGLGGLARTLVSGRAISRRLIACFALGVPIVAAVALLAADSGFFDRLVSRFAEDGGSANSRIVMWDMLTPLSWSDLIFGPDPIFNETNQRLLGIELGIESFWLAITLIFGLLAAGLLFAGLALFAIRLVIVAGQGAGPVVLFYFVVASTSTSLSSKTTGFGILVLMILVLLQPGREATIWLPRQMRELCRRCGITTG